MDPYEVCDSHRQNRYDLILLDLMMPGMDGFQVMEGLKEIDKDGYLPVLVISAGPEHKLRALKAGARDFISKPFDLAEVLSRVYNMLEVRKIHDDLELRVKERSGELVRANEQLLRKIEERKGADASLQSAYAEIKQLKDRFHAENIYLKQEIESQSTTSARSSGEAVPWRTCSSGSNRSRPRIRPFSCSARPARGRERWRAPFTAGAAPLGTPGR